MSLSTKLCHYLHLRCFCEQGWIDWRSWKHLSVVVGAAVGGGSLIYANVSAPAHREAFDKGWPPEITYQELSPYYDRTGKST